MLLWELLQSQWVAGQVSKVATKYIREVLNADVEFSNLRFNMFPPGAEVKDLYFTADKNNLKILAEASTVGIYFNPFDVFNTKFMIDNVMLKDGLIKIEVSKSSKTEKESGGLSKVNLDYFDYLKELPLNTATVVDLLIEYDEHSIYTNQLVLKNLQQSVNINGIVESFDLSRYINVKEMLDQVKIDADLSRKEIVLNQLSVKSGFASLIATGSIENYISINKNYDFKLKTKMPINLMHNFVDISKVGSLEKGKLEVISKVSGKGNNYKIDSKLKVNDFYTDFVYGEEASLNALITPEEIIFKEFFLKDKEQRIKLLKPFQFFDFKTKRFVEQPILVEATALKATNFLRYLRNDFDMLRGELSGKVRFDLYRNGFKFSMVDKVDLKNFKLQTNSFVILAAPTLAIDKSEFVLRGKDFILDTNIKGKETNLMLRGIIGKKDFNLTMPMSFVDLDEFSEVASYKMGGKGTFSFDLVKEADGLTLKTENDLKKFNFVGYSLDKFKADVVYLLDRNRIAIKKAIGSSGKATAVVTGEVNYETRDISLDYQIKKMDFNELKRILAPVMGDVTVTANEIHGDWDAKGTLTGKTNVDDLLADGSLKGRNNYFFNESVEKLSFDFKLRNSSVDIFNLIAEKGKGRITGDIRYDITQNEFFFATDLRDMFLSDFSYYSNLPISLRANFDGKVGGGYRKSGWFFESRFNLRDSYVNYDKYDDSSIILNFSRDDLYLKLDLFKSKLVADSRLDFLKKKRSYFNSDINFPDIKRFLGIFTNVDLGSSHIDGAINYQLKSDFDMETFKITQMYSNLQRFSLKKGDIEVDYLNSKPEFIVEDSEIKKWDLAVRGKKIFIISQGAGNISKDYKTTTQVKIDASIVEVFNTLINKAAGNIRGKVVYGTKSGKNLYEAFISSNNLNITSSLLPVVITKADTKISFRDKILNIEKFNAQLQSGSLDIGGTVSLKKVIPDVDIRYTFKNAGFSILRKSNLVLSGSGSLIGKTFPYTLGGDFFIQKFALVNELTDLGLSQRRLTQGDIDYLPGKSAEVQDQLLNFNLNVITREPMYIRNSITDVGFTGNLHIMGGEKEPKLSGKITLAPRNNKITFKSNDFTLTKGNVFFNERKNYKNPDLDFLASSNLGNFKVSAAVFGSAENFDFKLTSEPPLSQSDILSLIIFGYTEDLSNNLTDAEKESMTQAGVGSIIFDSFKINETLKNEFGIQVNLGTKVSKQQGSYLSKRSSDTSGSSSRVNTATTWEFKKKINDATTMSVSGTLGSSTTQKQSVNLNYKVNKNISLEGIYESTSTDDVQTINIPNSVGADVKWKWSFK